MQPHMPRVCASSTGAAQICVVKQEFSRHSQLKCSYGPAARSLHSVLPAEYPSCTASSLHCLLPVQPPPCTAPSLHNLLPAQRLPCTASSLHSILPAQHPPPGVPRACAQVALGAVAVGPAQLPAAWPARPVSRQAHEVQAMVAWGCGGSSATATPRWAAGEAARVQMCCAAIAVVAAAAAVAAAVHMTKLWHRWGH